MSSPAEETPGMMDQMKGALDGIFDKLDRFSEAAGKPRWHRTARRILIDLGLLFLVFGITSVMIGGANPLTPWGWFTSANIHGIAAGLANPGMATLMTLPILTAGAGVGLSFLIQDILPKKAHRGASKVMAVCFPLLIVAAAAALMMAGGGAKMNGLSLPVNFSFTRALTSPFFYVGLLLLPMGIFAADSASDHLSDKQVPILQGHPQRASRRRRPRPLSQQEEMRRQTERNHDMQIIELDDFN